MFVRISVSGTNDALGVEWSKGTGDAKLTKRSSSDSWTPYSLSFMDSWESVMNSSSLLVSESLYIYISEPILISIYIYIYIYIYISEPILIYIINISGIMKILHNCDLHYTNIVVYVLCKEIFKVSMYNNSLVHTTVVTDSIARFTRVLFELPCYMLFEQEIHIVEVSYFTNILIK